MKLLMFSVAVLAEVLVRAPRILLFFIIKKIFSGSKYPKINEFNSERNFTADDLHPSSWLQEQKRSLKVRRMVEKEADAADAERQKKAQEGLTVGNPGYRYHARRPNQARLDYVEMPQVPQAVSLHSPQCRHPACTLYFLCTTRI